MPEIIDQDIPLNEIAAPMPVNPTIDADGATINPEVAITVDADTVEEREQKYEKFVQYQLSDSEKRKIAQYVIKLIDDCVASRTAWQDVRTETIDMLNGVRAPKTDPWPNCSNITTMAIPMHCKLMHAKLFPAVYNENLVYWRPTEKNDVDNVEKIRKFMEYITRQEVRMQNIADDGSWNCITNGTLAFKIRWDTEYRMVASRNEDGSIKSDRVAHQKCTVDNINIDDVYLPQLWTDEDKSQYIAQNMYMTLPDIDDLIERNIFDGSHRDSINSVMSEVVAESIQSKRMEVEGTDPVFDAHKESYPLRLIECYMKWKIKGEFKESVFTIAYESGAYLSGKPLEAVSPTGKRPWVIGQFIRRPGRPYGISLPEIMLGLAKELDAIHNQRIDAGSIGIAPFGFYRAASSFKPENVQIGPGTMIPVDDIKDVNVVQLQHNPVASFQEERIIIEYIEKLTSTSAYQMGRESDIVKSRATASATLAIMSQGEQAYAILGIRMQEIFSRLMTKILQMYQAFMPSGYAERILGGESGALLFPGGLTPEEISGQYDAYMTLDPTAVNKSTERQANLAMVQMAPQLMGLAQDPRGYEMASAFLKSIGKVDIEKYLGPKPTGQGSAGGMGAFGKGNIPMGPGMGGVMPGGGGGAGGNTVQ